MKLRNDMTVKELLCFLKQIEKNPLSCALAPGVTKELARRSIALLGGTQEEASDNRPNPLPGDWYTY
jgi:hypothetical protein